MWDLYDWYTHSSFWKLVLLVQTHIEKQFYSFYTAIQTHASNTSHFKIKQGWFLLVSILISYVQRPHEMYASAQIYRYETDNKHFA